MRVVGLTGGIGSGKSTVARMLASRGAVCIDADQLARQAVEPGTPGLAAVVRHFGAGILNADGTLNRRALGRIVFADDAARRVLEGIIHPEVFAALKAGVEEARQSGARLAVLEVPLLYETQTGLALCDRVIVVWVPLEIQLQRLMERDRLTEAEARQRIAAQWPLDKKRALADFCIDNSGSLADTEAQVGAVWQQLLEGDVSCALH